MKKRRLYKCILDYVFCDQCPEFDFKTMTACKGQKGVFSLRSPFSKNQDLSSGSSGSGRNEGEE
jgi:hypothetical protein